MLKVWLVVVSMAFSFSLSADELYLVLNGKAIHDSNVENYNEKNWGLGFEYDFKPQSRWIPFVAGSSFKDSNRQISNYLGAGYKYRIPLDNTKDGWRVDLSFVAFFMTRRDFKNNKPFIGGLPFVAIGTSRAMLNIAYIPKVTPKSVGLFYFQLKFKIMEFD